MRTYRKKIATFIMSVAMVTQLCPPALAANEPVILTNENGGPRAEVGKMSSDNHEIIDVRFNDDKKHKVSIYLVDEDASGRWSIVDMIDPLTQKLMDSQNVYDFSKGVYLNYEVSGHVQIRLTNVWKTDYKKSKDTAVNGIFVDEVDAAQSEVAKVTTSVIKSTNAATKVEGYNVIGKIYTGDAVQPLSKRVPSIELRLNGNLNPDKANLDQMTVTSNGAIVPGEWRTSFYSATFVPTTYLTSGTYKVNVPATVKNIDGNSITASTFTFTVAPKVEVTYLSSDTMNDLIRRVDLTYNDRLVQSSADNKAKLYYKRADGTFQTLQTTKKGSNAGLMLEIANQPIFPSGTYKIEIQPGVQSVSGATSTLYQQEFIFDSKELSAKINAPTNVVAGELLPITIEKSIGYDQVRAAFSQEELATASFQPVKDVINIKAPDQGQQTNLYVQFKVTIGKAAGTESPILNKAVTVVQPIAANFVTFDLSAALDKDGFASLQNSRDGSFDTVSDSWSSASTSLTSDSFANNYDSDRDAKITQIADNMRIPYQFSPNIYVDGQKNMATNNGRQIDVPNDHYSDIYVAAIGKADTNEANYEFLYTDGTSEVQKITTRYWENQNSNVNQLRINAYAAWKSGNIATAYIDVNKLHINPDKTLDKITIKSSTSFMRTLAISGKVNDVNTAAISPIAPAGSETISVTQTVGDTNTLASQPEILAAIDTTQITNVPVIQPGQPVPDPALLQEAQNNPTGQYGQTLYPFARQAEKIMSYKVRMQAYENYELNYEDVMEVIRRVDNVTRGLDKKIYLVGWQKDGHDTGFPQLDQFNPRHARPGETPIESLKWLIKEAKEKYHTAVSLHVNFSDGYVDDNTMGPYMAQNNIIGRNADGTLSTGGVWSGHQAYSISNWANWFTGNFKNNQIKPLMDKLPELEGQSLHPDAWFTGANPYYNKSIYDTADAKRRMMKYMRDTYNMDLTTEFDTSTDNINDFDYIQYIPLIWQLGWNDDRNDPMKVPSYIMNGVYGNNHSNNLTKSSKYFGFGLAVEPNLWNGVDAPITIPGIKGEFAQQELTHQFFNSMLRNSLVDNSSTGGQAVLYNSAGQRIVSSWVGNNNTTMKRTVTIGNDVIVQDPNNVFMPMVWRANREIQAWSKAGYTNRAWKLPVEWNDVTNVDIYDLSVEGLKFDRSAAVSGSTVSLSLKADQSAIIVPQGQDPNSVDKFNPQGTVTFVSRDTTTQGNWTTKYGRAGYDIFNSATQNMLPQNVSVSYINSNFVTSAVKTLMSVTTPAAVTGLAFGTAKTAAALKLPERAVLVTESGNVDASVIWDLSNINYDPTINAAQTFTVPGTVTLPSLVTNSNNVPLTTSVSVSVQNIVKVEAENYVAMSGIQLENASEGTKNVGFIDSGDWMDYAVNVPETGIYKLNYRVSVNTGNTGRVNFLVDGVSQKITSLPSTGGWQNWTTVSDEVSLSAGQHTIRLRVEAGSWNINWFELVAPPAPATPKSTLTGVQQVDSGQNFTLKMGLADVTQSVYQQVYAQDFTLQYDPASVQFVSVTSLVDGFRVIDKDDSVSGTVRIVAASVGANIPAQGDMFAIQFKAKSVAQATNTTISVDHVKIANAPGNELQVGRASRQIQITVPAIPVDKSQLNTAIASAQAKYAAAVEGNKDGLYAVGSKTQLQSAIDAASAIANNSNATQQQVNDANAALEAAVRLFDSKLITADVNGNGNISIGDLALVSKAYGKESGQTGWNEKADVNHDGKVDIEDLAIVARAILQ